MNTLSYVGVVQKNEASKEQDELANNHQHLQLIKSETSPDIIFTIPKEDFMHIQNMVSIKCNIEDVVLFEIPAFIHGIKKIKGKHQMYVVTLHVHDQYASSIKPGMLVEVDIEHVVNSIQMKKDSA
ncbi:hypothetical protein [Labilibacter marinus]|uniref:hypothetical protein n=1 Tax=Labilibacter marinus TaxID=1477105 RepID=UPI00094FA70E|nr:hypothetical protein [Labilibacter marinus]